MSKDRKTKISQGNLSKTSRSAIEEDILEDKSKNETEIKKDDIRQIEIRLEEIENVKSIHQISFIHIKSEFNGKTLSVTEKYLTIDGKVKLNSSVVMIIDALYEKDLDDLISKPLIVTIHQTLGGIDDEFFNQIQYFDEIGADKTSFDSAISIYEAFTGEPVEDKELLKENRKKKGKQSIAASSNEKIVPKAETKTKTKEKTKGKKNDKSSSKKSNDDLNKSVNSEKDTSAIIGMGTLDLLPLILGNTLFFASIDIKPTTPLEDDQIVTYKTSPKLTVEVSIDRPIELPESSTILCFTVESIFNIPQIMCSPDSECRICAWLPLTDDFTEKIVLVNSSHKAEDTEYEMKVWPNISINGGNANATSYRIRKGFDDVKYNSLTSVSEIIKNDNPKLVYNCIKRNIVTSYNKNVLQNYLSRYRTICLEMLIADSDSHLFLDDKPKKSPSSNFKVNEPKKKGRTSFLHLMALVDISSLIYPGVSRTRVACQLSTFHEKEVLKATSIQESYFLPKNKSIDVVHPNTSERGLKKAELDKTNRRKLDASNASISTKKGGQKNDATLQQDLKDALPPPPVPEDEEEPSTKIFNETGDPTVIVIEIEIAEPLVKARIRDESLTELNDLTIDNPVLPKITFGTENLESNYTQVVQKISANLNTHLKNYMREKNLCQCSSQADFLTYLRRMEVYPKYLSALKEGLLPLVDKYYDVSGKNDGRSPYNMGDIFVKLVGQMNTILNKKSCSITGLYQEGPLSSLGSTLLYAKEASALRQYARANNYYTQRIALDEKNPNLWFDYALFQLEMDSPELALEFIEQALLEKLHHVNSVLLYGLLLANKDRMLDAEICFKLVVENRARWTEGWTILFLLYHKTNNLSGMAYAEEKAKQYLDDSRTNLDYFTKSEDLSWTTDILPTTIFFKAAALLLKLRMYIWVEYAMSFELVNHPGKVNYILAVICYYQGDYDHAICHLNEAKLTEGWNYAIVTLSGHCLMLKEKYEAAVTEYFYVLESFNKPNDMHLLYLNCATSLNLLERNQEARKMILIACKNNPTPHTWITAGTLYYCQNDLLSAEECFEQANLCDHHLSEAWAFLTLINLKQDKDTEANLCYEQALRNGFYDTRLSEAIDEEVENFRVRNEKPEFSLRQTLFNQ